MSLSLVTIYRRRLPHLETQLAWWQQVRASLSDCEWIVIEADTTPTPELAARLSVVGATYRFLPNSGVLHKTQALNLGLTLAQGDYLAPWDVDLLPIGSTLVQHLRLARLSPDVLMTGYRLMAEAPTLDLQEGLEAITVALTSATIAPEDQPSALRKHLLQGEKFGVMPFFQRQHLQAIHGWDEAFVGWGAEDQDLIERYLGTTGLLCRSPQLVYLHLHHEADPQWREETCVEANRQLYYQKRALHIPMAEE
jgi:hypothetical protein